MQYMCSSKLAAGQFKTSDESIRNFLPWNSLAIRDYRVTFICPQARTFSGPDELIDRPNRRSHHHCCSQDASSARTTTAQQIRHVCYSVCWQLLLPIRPLFQGHNACLLLFRKGEFWGTNTWAYCFVGTFSFIIQTSSWETLFKWCCVWNDSWSFRVQAFVILLAIQRELYVCIRTIFCTFSLVDSNIDVSCDLQMQKHQCMNSISLSDQTVIFFD